MAKDNKKKVEQITDMEVDFAQWYTDVCRKAELIDYSSIKGMFIYRPYGYAIWENIQAELDRRFKETGHENVYLHVGDLFDFLLVVLSHSSHPLIQNPGLLGRSISVL